jgi:hypothetical protein
VLGAFECPEVLVSARKGGSAPDRYLPPTPAESVDMAQLFARLSRQDPRVLQKEADALGFRLAPVSEQSGVWSLVEVSQRKRGGGAYLLRLPASFFDEGTLPLACELFQRSGALALFIETAHRYKAAEASDSGSFPADLAHAKESLFQAATEGLLRDARAKTLIQLHGFGPRDSDANVVLSNGASDPNPLVDSVRQALGNVVTGVLRFPQQTRDLGATTNVQGLLARSRGARFLHVEMSAPLRAQLLRDGALRARFLEALVRGLGNQ